MNDSRSEVEAGWVDDIGRCHMLYAIMYLLDNCCIEVLRSDLLGDLDTAYKSLMA